MALGGGRWVGRHLGAWGDVPRHVYIQISVYIVFDRNSYQSSVWALKVGNVEIPRVTFTKFLGTWIDDKLSWKTHTSKLVSKLKCGLGMLQRSKPYLSTVAKKCLYYGQVHSHLNYAIGIWGPMINIQTLKKLSKIQRQCVRLINTNLGKEELFTKLNILTVEQMIKYEQCKIGYKLCHSLLPIKLENLIKHDHHHQPIVKSHKYNTRQKDVPNRPNVSLKLYRTSFLYKSVQEYSELPTEIRDTPHIKLFAKNCKKLILNM